ncbi:hypothetical protein [Tessaracoccus sp. Z1128]
MSQQVLGDVKVAASGPAYWRAVWSTRHTVAAVVAAVALFVALNSARETTGALEVTVLVLAALLGAVTLATYVPPAGVAAREHLTGGSCGIIPAAAVVVAPFMLSQAPATLVALAALLACYGVAAAKRITDHASC